MSFCRNCGKELKGTEKFCASCGSPVPEQKEELVAQQNKADNAGGKKKVGIIVAAVVVAIAVIVAIVFALNSGKKEKEYNNYIASAEKYLAENDYDQAIVAYLEAIEVDEKKLKPYVEVAEIYIEQREYVKAKDILEQAEENDAQGTEEEEQVQEELAVLVLDIVDDMVLDEEKVLNIIEPILDWMWVRYEEFETLTLEQKIEISSLIAYKNEVESVYADAYYLQYSKDVIAEVMRENFGEEPDYSQINDTDLIRVLDGTIELYWPSMGYEWWFEHKVDTIEQQDDGRYIVEVIYSISDVTMVGSYEYLHATYEFKYDHLLENGFYIDDLKMENIYKGDDYVEEQQAVYLEEVRGKILDYYTKLWKPEGKYVSFDSEDYIDWGVLTMVVRYQMSDKEAEERIANGGFPEANTYVTSVNIDLSTGEVTDEWGENWTIELPGK